MGDMNENDRPSPEGTPPERPERSERPAGSTTAVRYGRMNRVGEFTCPANLQIPCGAAVIIATDRGIELGRQLPLTCASSPHCVGRDQMRRYARASGPDVYLFNNGRILRLATESDEGEARHLESGIPDKIRTCQQTADELGLQMKVVDAEHIFGGERIIFYFLAEQRVDFRELVRRLAREFQTRIEMKQIGSRDEARLLADYETCGRECCCKNFLKTLKPVTMQMAKLQKATLDPTKVSGRCGRLKCCLRYEHDTYEELSKRLPRTGRRVATAREVGRVLDRQVLTQLVRLRTDDGKIVTIAVEDIVEVDVPEPPPPQPGESSDRPGAGSRRERPRTGGDRPGFRRREEPPGGRPSRPDSRQDAARPGAGRPAGGEPAEQTPPGPEAIEAEVPAADEVVEPGPGDDSGAPARDASGTPPPEGPDTSAPHRQRPGRRRGRRHRGRRPRDGGGGGRPSGGAPPG